MLHLEHDHHFDATPAPLERVRLFELDFVDAVSTAEVADDVMARLGDTSGPGLPAVVTPNVDILCQLSGEQDPSIVSAFREAWWVLPDGQPVVAVSRLAKRPLGARLTGSDLFSDVWDRLIDSDTPAVVVANSDEVAAGLTAQHPKTAVVVPPIFDVTDHDAIEHIAQQVRREAIRLGAPIALSGLSYGKDQLIAAAIDRDWPREQQARPITLCVGASFQMHLGHRRRAPKAVQRLALEWLWRFALEPRRLFHRYFVRDRAFLGLAWRELRRRKPDDADVVRMVSPLNPSIPAPTHRRGTGERPGP